MDELTGVPIAQITPAFAAMAALVAMSWFPLAADALSTRSTVPSLPQPGSLWTTVCQRPARSTAAAIAAGAVAVRFGSAPLDGLVVFTVLGCGVLSALVDVRCHRLPDAITAPLWAVAWPVMVAVAVADGNAIRIRFALLAGVVVLVVLGVGWLMGMGLGDVKLGALLALMTGWLTSQATDAVLYALAVVFIAAMGAVVHSVLGWAGGWSSRLDSGSLWVQPKTSAPKEHRWFAFGPYLVAGATVVIMAVGPTVTP